MPTADSASEGVLLAGKTGDAGRNSNRISLTPDGSFAGMPARPTKVVWEARSLWRAERPSCVAALGGRHGWAARVGGAGWTARVGGTGGRRGAGGRRSGVGRRR